MNKDNHTMLEKLQTEAWKNLLIQSGVNAEQIESVIQNEGLEGLKKLGKEFLKKTTPLAVGTAVMAGAPEAEARGITAGKKHEKSLEQKVSKKTINSDMEKQIELVGILLDYRSNGKKMETQMKLMNLFGVKNLEDLEGALREYAIIDKNNAVNVEYAINNNLTR